MKVKECMKKQPAVYRSTPLSEIINLFKKNNLRLLPVLDSENHIRGVITLEEIISVFQPESGNLSELLKTVPFIETLPESEINMDYISPEMGILVVADEIMSGEYFTVSQNDSASKAYSFMKGHKAEVLIAVDDEDKMSGVIGIFDIIYSIFKEKGIVK